jgi:hypothetical protein
MAKKKSSKNSSNDIGNKLRETADEILEEVDQAGDSMLQELRAGFDSISKRLSNAASVAQKTSKSVSSKVRDIDSRDVLLKLMDEVEEISSVIMDGVGKQFNELRDKLQEAETEAAAGSKTAKKKRAKKSAATKTARKKKKTAKGRSKSSANKKVVRKKSAGRKR